MESNRGRREARYSAPQEDIFSFHPTDQPISSRLQHHIVYQGLTLIVVTSALRRSFSMLSLYDKSMVHVYHFQIVEIRYGKLFPELWGLAVKDKLPPPVPRNVIKAKKVPRYAFKIKVLLLTLCGIYIKKSI